MSKLYKLILEDTVRKIGKEIAIMLTLINIAVLLALQELNMDIPFLLKTNILMILAGIFFLEVRPR